MADGTTVDANRRVQQPPPPPPPPKVEQKPDAAQAQQRRSELVASETAATERRGEAGQELLANKARAPSAPPMPGEVAATRAIVPAAKAEQPAAKPEETKPEGSRFSRFMGGLWDGAKSGVKGIYEGGKALVTDPVGTAKAVKDAAVKAGEATIDYGKRLVNDPGKTLQETKEWAGKKIEDVKNAKAEDWGKVIGEGAVGAVGGYGAGKALQGLKALKAANTIAKATPDAPNPKLPAGDKTPDVKTDKTPDTPEPVRTEPVRTEPVKAADGTPLSENPTRRLAGKPEAQINKPLTKEQSKAVVDKIEADRVALGKELGREIPADPKRPVRNGAETTDPAKSEKLAAHQLMESAGTRHVVAGENNVRAALGQPLDQSKKVKSTDLLRKEKDGSHTPIEVKNEKTASVDHALAKFKEIEATATKARDVKGYELLIGEQTKLPPNFKVDQSGRLYTGREGTWHPADVNGKPVTVRRAYLGEVGT